MLASLRIAALLSLLALAAALPIFTVGVPCLSQTSPDNNLGGRLGTLTDLSLLRLLNALDPSPSSQETSNLLRLSPYVRALTSTVAPAIDNSRVRLIILLVILAVLGCGGGLFLIARTYAAFAAYRRRLEEDTCAGLDMVIIAGCDAPGWTGLSEESLKKRLKGYSAGERERRRDVDIVGVFAIPNTSGWAGKVQEREDVLQCLEEAEVKFINSFTLVATASYGRRLESWPGDFGRPPGRAASAGRPASDFLAPEHFDKLSSGRPLSGSQERLDVPVPTSPVEMAHNSKFHEINRDSALYGKRFSIGQRIRVGEEGQYLPDPSPDSETTNPLGSTGSGTFEKLSAGPEGGAGLRGEHEDPFGRASPPFSEGSRVSRGPPSTPPHIGEGTAPTPITRRNGTEGPQVRPGPARRAEVVTSSTAAVISSQRPSQEQSPPLCQPYKEIRDHRTKLKALNVEIEYRQQKAFVEVASGENVKGWVIVGKGVRYLSGCGMIEGRTKEDILWPNVRRKAGEGIFCLKVILVGLVLDVVMVPFIALTVGTAPGFAHYLGLMKPLARSNSFGSGIVEGFVPALAISLLVGLAIYVVNHSALRVRVVSRTSQRILAYKATFYLLLVTTVFWLVTVAALEYAVQGFESDVQPARSVGDGAVYSTWFIFITLLNIAVIVPGLYLLQAKRLVGYRRLRRKAITPRQRFRLRQPASFNPSYGLLPFLIAVFYAFSMIFLFPLLAIPILLLLFLSLVANRYMVDHVFVEGSGGYTGATIGLWTLRRFGWVLGIQPALYGLILLSRAEWALGGASLGVAVATIAISEGLTVTRFRSRSRTSLSKEDQKALDDMQASMTSTGTAASSSSRSHRISDSSMMQRLAALLPGYSRLPPECPLPLLTEDIDDLFHTEKASYARPELVESSEKDAHRSRRFFHDPSDTIRGLIYPPEMLAPTPVIWLPNDRAGVAEAEAADLEAHHGLPVIVDPVKEPERKAGEKRPSGPLVEASSPLLI